MYHPQQQSGFVSQYQDELYAPLNESPSQPHHGQNHDSRLYLPPQQGAPPYNLGPLCPVDYPVWAEFTTPGKTSFMDMLQELGILQENSTGIVLNHSPASTTAHIQPTALSQTIEPCYNCGICGHWAQFCPEPRKEIPFGATQRRYACQGIRRTPQSHTFAQPSPDTHLNYYGQASSFPSASPYLTGCPPTWGQGPQTEINHAPIITHGSWCSPADPATPLVSATSDLHTVSAHDRNVSGGGMLDEFGDGKEFESAWFRNYESSHHEMTQSLVTALSQNNGSEEFPITPSSSDNTIDQLPKDAFIMAPSEICGGDVGSVKPFMRNAQALPWNMQVADAKVPLHTMDIDNDGASVYINSDDFGVASQKFQDTPSWHAHCFDSSFAESAHSTVSSIFPEFASYQDASAQAPYLDLEQVQASMDFQFEGLATGFTSKEMREMIEREEKLARLGVTGAPKPVIPFRFPAYNPPRLPRTVSHPAPACFANVDLISGSSIQHSLVSKVTGIDKDNSNCCSSLDQLPMPEASTQLEQQPLSPSPLLATGHDALAPVPRPLDLNYKQEQDPSRPRRKTAAVNHVQDMTPGPYRRVHASDRNSTWYQHHSSSNESDADTVVERRHPDATSSSERNGLRQKRSRRGSFKRHGGNNSRSTIRNTDRRVLHQSAGVGNDNDDEDWRRNSREQGHLRSYRESRRCDDHKRRRLNRNAPRR